MYTFSVAALVWGIIVMGLGAVFIRFHRAIANEIGGGLGSYEKFKLYGLIAIGFGVLLMFNLPAYLLTLIFSNFFGGL